MVNRRTEGFLVGLALASGAAFLLKMCYLSLAFNTGFGLTYLTGVYYYARLRHDVRLPLRLLFMVFAALQIDALGNFFRMYGRQFGPMQYDEFSHLTVQALITPFIVWLAGRALMTRGYGLSLSLTSFLAGTTMFSLAAFYEIIELWDEVYFHGQRIWSTHDTATDLQWDLVGILIGVLLSFLVIKARSGAPSRSIGLLVHFCRHLKLVCVNMLRSC